MQAAQDVELQLDGVLIHVFGASATIEKCGLRAKIFVHAGKGFPIAWISVQHPRLPSWTQTFAKSGWYMYSPFAHMLLEQTGIRDEEKLNHPDGV